jgi:homoserine dehydrogenase
MTAMGKTLRVGIAGLGTVGGGTLRLLRANAELLAQRTGRRLEVRAVSARDPGRRRELDLDGRAGTATPAPSPRTPRSTSSAS